MSSIPIAVQLYSLREDAAKDFQAAIESVGKIGYDAIEFAGYFNHSAAEIKSYLDGAGVKCAGTHAPLPTIIGDELARTAEFNLTYGNPYLIVPGVGKEYQETREGVLKLAEIFTQAAEKGRELGVKIGYHNHTWEFKPVEDGVLPFQILAENTPDDFIVQLDTGNAQEAGFDPIPFLNDWKERILTPHLKPYVKNEDEFARYFIGEDDTDWQAVLNAIKEAGTAKYLIVEQERYPEPNTPLQCIERCLKNLKPML